MSVRLFEVDLAGEEDDEQQAFWQLRDFIEGDPHGRLWFVVPGPNGWTTAFVRMSVDNATGLAAFRDWLMETEQGRPEDVEVPVDTPLPFHRRAQ